MRAKKCMFTGLLLLILLVTLLQTNMLQASYLETSFVYLIIRSDTRELKSDYFFEILDMGDYILLPVSALAAHLGLQIDYQREHNILNITHRTSDKTVMVDFNQEEYWGYPEWAHQPPSQHEGDFYITPLLLEGLAQVRITWNPRRQEVMIRVPHEDPEETEEDAVREKAPWELLTLTPDTVGPDYALGSLQYKLAGIAKYSEAGTWSYASRQALNLHGRLQDWAVSLGLSSNYSFTEGKATFAVPLVRATYREHDQLIILGDSRVEFPQTFAREDIRGLYWQQPSFFLNRYFSYVTVTGLAAKGSTVRLVLNGELYSEQRTGDSEIYLFADVPLVVNRSNTIRIVIYTLDGRREEHIKSIAGHNRVLPGGTNELALGAGWYGEVNDWDGRMGGLLYNLAVTDNLSFGLETIARQQLTPVGYDQVELGLVAGFAGRLFNNTAFTLDLLGGGYVEDLAAGVRTSLGQTFTSGYLGASYSYIPPQVTRTVPEVKGHHLSLIGEYDITRRWGLRLQGDIRRSLPVMAHEKRNRVLLTVLYREEWRHSTALTLLGGTREFDVEVDTDEFIRIGVEEGGVELEHTRRTSNFDGRFSLGYVASKLYLPDDEIAWEGTVTSKVSLSQAVSPSLRLYGNLELEAVLLEHELEEGVLDLDSSFRWMLGSMSFLTGRAISKLTVADGEFLEPEQGETKAEINLLHFFNYDTSVRLGGSYSWLPHIDASYYYLSLTATYLWADRRGNFTVDLGYKSPVAPREDFQLSAAVRLGWLFENAMGLEVEAKRAFQTVYDETLAYIFTVSLAQTLGFVPGRVIGQKYDEIRQHNAFIGGLVFLDLNGNGQYDEGEPLLSGVPILLGGIRDTTDAEGRFLFEHVRADVYRVGFDLQSLPVEYNVVTAEKVVEIRENENFFLYYGLTLNGVISGRVFMDYDASGTFDTGDEPLPFVGIYIESLDKTIYTRRDGTFYIENVPLGEHTLKVLPASLPAHTTAGPYQMTIVNITAEDLFVENLSMPVTYIFDE